MPIVDLGLMGSSQTKTAGTTLEITNTSGSPIPVGTLLVLSMAQDNAATTASPSNSLSTGAGTWTQAGSPVGSGVTTTAGAGIWQHSWYVLTTSEIAINGTITTVTTPSVAARAAVVVGLSGAAPILRGTVVTGTSTGGTPAATSGNPTLGDVVIGCIGGENNSVPTGDADTLDGSWSSIEGINTSGSSAATNVCTGIQVKVPTGTSAQVYNPTTSNDSVARVFILQPVNEFTQAPADTEGLTDAVASAFGYDRSAGDDSGMTDEVTLTNVTASGTWIFDYAGRIG
jgi:hypothetical protein